MSTGLPAYLAGIMTGRVYVCPVRGTCDSIRQVTLRSSEMDKQLFRLTYIKHLVVECKCGQFVVVVSSRQSTSRSSSSVVIVDVS